LTVVFKQKKSVYQLLSSICLEEND